MYIRHHFWLGVGMVVKVHRGSAGVFVFVLYAGLCVHVCCVCVWGGGRVMQPPRGVPWSLG